MQIFYYSVEENWRTGSHIMIPSGFLCNMCIQRHSSSFLFRQKEVVIFLICLLTFGNCSSNVNADVSHMHPINCKRVQASMRLSQNDHALKYYHPAVVITREIQMKKSLNMISFPVASGITQHYCQQHQVNKSIF